MPNNPVSVLILAAGKGVRMKSRLPKVLHPVAGTPMIERVCRSVHKLKPRSLSVVIGHGGEDVRFYVKERYPKAAFFTQKVLDGSGGAVRQTRSWLKAQKGDIIITCGDAPLIKTETFKALLNTHRRERNAVTVLTTKLHNAFGYGRILRRPNGTVERIIEELDATPDERRIKEINTGTYVFNAKILARVLPKLENNNAKKEYYLTDTLELINRQGGRVGGAVCLNPDEVIGINNRRDLAKAHQLAFRRKAFELMTEGVTILDPDDTYVEDAVRIGPDTVVWPQTFVIGQSSIGSGCLLGPWAYIKDCKIENDVIFQSSFAESSIIQKGARVGPFSRVRPNSTLSPGAHLGNFSEVKNTRLGPGSKANHLTYLGDATVGKNVNIGAGTITCNYDGFKKHPTIIEDHAFIGSNANLIAPIRVGARSVVGAGSSLSEDVPAGALALERARPIVKAGWAKSRLKKKGGRS